MATNERNDERTRARTTGALLLGMTVASFITGAYAVHASMPFNAMALPGEKPTVMRSFLPEGWRFFTRDPQEERLATFVRAKDGRWISGSAGVNAQPALLFGLDRSARAQGVEVGVLLEQAPPARWSSCEGAPVDCIEHASTAVHIVSTTPRPSLCGEVAIVKQKPVPWAWATSKRPVVMPSHVVRLEVQC